MNNQTNNWSQGNRNNQSNAGNQATNWNQPGMSNQSGNNNQINNSIGCIVTECEYHANSQNYCTLNHIDVVKHEQTAKTVECTDCGSFKKQS